MWITYSYAKVMGWELTLNFWIRRAKAGINWKATKQDPSAWGVALQTNGTEVETHAPPPHDLSHPNPSNQSQHHPHVHCLSPSPLILVPNPDKCRTRTCMDTRGDTDECIHGWPWGWSAWASHARLNLCHIQCVRRLSNCYGDHARSWEQRG